MNLSYIVCAVEEIPKLQMKREVVKVNPHNRE